MIEKRHQEYESEGDRRFKSICEFFKEYQSRWWLLWLDGEVHLDDPDEAGSAKILGRIISSRGIEKQRGKIVSTIANECSEEFLARVVQECSRMGVPFEELMVAIKARHEFELSFNKLRIILETEPEARCLLEPEQREYVFSVWDESHERYEEGRNEAAERFSDVMEDLMDEAKERGVSAGLWNAARLVRAGAPLFVGAFENASELPHGTYPPFYYWAVWDRDKGGIAGVSISMNLTVIHEIAMKASALDPEAFGEISKVDESVRICCKLVDSAFRTVASEVGWPIDPSDVNWDPSSNGVRLSWPS